jgi:hypothetical protein
MLTGMTAGSSWLRIRRPVRDALSVVGLGGLIILLLNPDAHGQDAHAYWAFDLGDPYTLSQGSLTARDGFLYSPVAAQLFAPFHALPWPVFITAWTLLLAAATVWLGRSWGLALIGLYPVLLELSSGNISLILAVVIVLGFRRPGMWALVLLTKVTPGIGLFWFVLRREWRAAAEVLVVTAVAVIVSALVAPDLWPKWVDLLAGSATLADPGAFGAVPRWLRFLLAFGLVAWAAATDRRWLVPVAAGVATPVSWLFAPIMFGAIPLWREQARRNAASTLEA